MNDLIETLKAQHDLMVSRVRRVSEALTGKQLGVLRTNLHTLRLALTDHQELEETRLYADLVAMAAALDDSHRALLARAFASNMNLMNQVIIRFIDRIQRGPEQFPFEAFAKEWARISEAFILRLEAEEGTLFPLYERCVQDASLPRARRAEG